MPAAKPGQTDKTDVVSWLITDGHRTFSSAGGNSPTSGIPSLSFDALLNVVNWHLAALPVGEVNNGNVMSTDNRVGFRVIDV